MINAPHTHAHTITMKSNQDITIMRRATEILNKDKAREQESERGRQKRISMQSSSIVFLRCLGSVPSRTGREQTLS